jgi:HSP20 family protein
MRTSCRHRPHGVLPLQWQPRAGRAVKIGGMGNAGRLASPAPKRHARKETIMANITRFSPFRELERFSPFHDFEEMWKNLRLRPFAGEMEGMRDIRVDVSEDDQAYTVKADLPGVAKEDIKVKVDGNRVSITAEVKRESEEQGRNMLCTERSCGQQFRSFTLESAIDESKADAKYENGVLTLTLPKKPGAAAHELPVH